MTLAELLRLYGKGREAIGKVVKVGSVVGEVVAFERSGEVVLIRCRATGALRRGSVRNFV
jgi:hypothetical protein